MSFEIVWLYRPPWYLYPLWGVRSLKLSPRHLYPSIEYLKECWLLPFTGIRK